MKVLNLRCGAQHVFEGWFGSEADFQDQHARGLVSCPMCGNAAIEKMLSAPRLNLGAAVAESPAPLPQADVPTLTPETQAKLWRAMRQAIAQADDVGERFADVARRMHQGDIEARQIRGRASMQETLALLDEGVPVLPLPAALKDTLQ